MLKEEKESPVRLLLSWAGKDRYYLYLSVLCSFISGFSTMIPYYGVYRLLDAAYRGNCTREVLLEMRL